MNDASAGVGGSPQALLDGCHPAIAVSLVVAVLGVAAMTLPRGRRPAPSPEPCPEAV